VVIAIDAGTTGVRSFAVDAAGQPVGWSYREFPQYFPEPGWVEHDAIEIWDAVQTTLHELCSRLNRPIAAIGITNQRETTVAWDRRTGQPLARAIVWQDRRGAARVDELRESGLLPFVRARTGLVLDPYFSATKIEWLLRHGVASGADLALGTIDSWLVWKLSGGKAHVTDPSNASRTLLYDIVQHRWSPELLEVFGVPASALAEVVPTSGRCAVTADGLSVPAGIAISSMVGDQQSALFGQACSEPGMTKNTYGTGSFVLMNAGTSCPPPTDGLLTTVAWQLGSAPPVYATEGSIFVTGAAIGWLRDELGLISASADIAALAGSVPDSAGLVLVPAFTGLGSPWWDPYARGTLIGISAGVGAGHLARAVIDAAVFQTRDVIETMAAATGTPARTLRVDGGASVVDLLLQLQADQLGVVVERPQVAETTALGAALLAGLAEGVWGSTSELASIWRLDASFAPRSSPTTDPAYQRWRNAVNRSLNWDR
jgi:glycerol kinase